MMTEKDQSQIARLLHISRYCAVFTIVDCLHLQVAIAAKIYAYENCGISIPKSHIAPEAGSGHSISE